MKKLDKATRILAKLVEVAHWIAAGTMLLMLALSFPDGTDIVRGVELATLGQSLSTYGFEMSVTAADGGVLLSALRLFCVSSVALLCPMAMVFRNIWLIMKRSESTTPFQKDNVRMVREIGFFLLSIPVIGLIMSGVARLTMGIDLVETSVGLDSFMVGLVVLCLSRIFARGMELEADVDGLL